MIAIAAAQDALRKEIYANGAFEGEVAGAARW